MASRKLKATSGVKHHQKEQCQRKNKTAVPSFRLLVSFNNKRRLAEGICERRREAALHRIAYRLTQVRTLKKQVQRTDLLNIRGEGLASRRHHTSEELAVGNYPKITVHCRNEATPVTSYFMNILRKFPISEKSEKMSG